MRNLGSDLIFEFAVERKATKTSESRRKNQQNINAQLIHKIRRFCVYRRMARKTPRQPSTMAKLMPQKLMTEASSLLRMFIPKMPATIAPIVAEKLPMESVSSRRLTSYRLALRDTPMDSSRSRAPAWCIKVRPCQESKRKCPARLTRKKPLRLVLLCRGALQVVLEQVLRRRIVGPLGTDTISGTHLDLLDLLLLLLGLDHLLQGLLRLLDVVDAVLQAV